MTLQVVILPAKVLADGTHKLRISIAHNGLTRYYNTRFIVPDKKNVKNGVVVGVGNASYINQQLRNLMSRMNKAYDEIQDSDYMTCPQLLELIKAKMHASSLFTFELIADDFLKFKRSQVRESSCLLIENCIETFKTFAGKDYMLSLLNINKIYEYVQFLEKRGLSNSTINNRIVYLRTLVRFAVKHKYVNYEIDPFEGYKERPNNSRDCALTIQDLRKIRDHVFEKDFDRDFQDLFMLSFYMCGMNQADLIRLKFNTETIKFLRQKVSSRVSVDRRSEYTIQPEAREIIDRHSKKDGTLLFRNCVNIMRLHSFVEQRRRSIVNKLELGDNFKFYSARKTFAQLAAELGVQERVIAYCLGDTPPLKSNGSVIGYYVKLNKKIADEAIRLVFDFVASDYTDTATFLEQRSRTGSVEQKRDDE